MATLNIKDPDVHRMAHDLAQRRGTSATGAVRDALREALEADRADREGRVERVRAAARALREASDEPFLTDDDLYDDAGLPR